MSCAVQGCYTLHGMPFLTPCALVTLHKGQLVKVSTARSIDLDVFPPLVQVICHLFQAQLHLAEGGRRSAAESLAAAQAALNRLPPESGGIQSQLRLHHLLLETIQQLAEGETGTGMLTGIDPATGPVTRLPCDKQICDAVE